MIIEITNWANKILLEQYFNSDILVTITLCLLLGLCVGSFINVICYRTPILAEKLENEYIHTKYNIKINTETFVDTKRSHCPSCKAQIKMRHNIPVIGWLLLKGKANCCGNQISIKYPIVELFTGLIFTYIGYTYGVISIETILLLVTTSAAIVICAIDLKHKIVFDKHAFIYLCSLIFLHVSGSTNTNILVTGLIILLLHISYVKTHEFIRKAITKQDLCMMGSGDWALWYGLFITVASASDQNTIFINIACAFLVCFGVTGTIMLLAYIKNKKLNKNVLTTEIPAAPAIILTTMLWYWQAFLT